VDSTFKPKAPNRAIISEARNLDRIGQANRRDSNLIGKYLPLSVPSIFDEVVQGVDDSFVPPKWLLLAVAKVAREQVTTPLQPVVIFDTSDEHLTSTCS
jgi:hypothetical protein